VIKLVISLNDRVRDVICITNSEYLDDSDRDIVDDRVRDIFLDSLLIGVRDILDDGNREM